MAGKRQTQNPDPGCLAPDYSLGYQAILPLMKSFCLWSGTYAARKVTACHPCLLVVGERASQGAGEGGGALWPDSGAGTPAVPPTSLGCPRVPPSGMAECSYHSGQQWPEWGPGLPASPAP